MSNKPLQGKRALVTGASSGLGVDFARELASRGCDLVLVARREDRLAAVRDEITQAHGVSADVLAMDLTLPSAPDELFAATEGSGKQIDVLVNNAGFGTFGEFADSDWLSEQRMLQLNIVTLTHLTKLFLAPMKERDYGFMLQVSSIGGYQPTPLYGTYSATKAFVLSFGEALSYELRKTNVRCTVVSPGVTATEFLQTSGQDTTLYQRLAMMSSEKVARIGVKAMLRGKPSKVTGFLNAWTVWWLRFFPRRLQAALAFMTMKTRSDKSGDS